MFKKSIPLFAVLCMLVSMCAPVSATGYDLRDDSTLASAEAYGPAA